MSQDLQFEQKDLLFHDSPFHIPVDAMVAKPYHLAYIEEPFLTDEPRYIVVDTKSGTRLLPYVYHVATEIVAQAWIAAIIRLISDQGAPPVEDVFQGMNGEERQDVIRRAYVEVVGREQQPTQPKGGASSYVEMLLRLVETEVFERVLSPKPIDPGTGTTFPSLEQLESLLAACVADEAIDQDIRQRYNAFFTRIREDLLPIWQRASAHFNTVLGMVMEHHDSFETSWLAKEHLALQEAIRHAAQETPDSSVQCWYVASWMRQWRMRRGTDRIPTKEAIDGEGSH